MIPSTVIAQVSELARTIPADLARAIANQIDATADSEWVNARGAILAVVPQANARHQVAQLLDEWPLAAPTGSRRTLAWALAAAAQTASAERGEERVSLVWTGPHVNGPALRRTDQALQEVIGAARQELLLVSFAVYRVPHIAQALVEAAGRGVKIRIALETPAESAGRIDYDTVRSLGADVARNADLYVWPESQRGRDAQGNLGALHAKCAVADRELLFISSANLTGYALTINMELGVIVRGGGLPGDVATVFTRLIEHGVLQRMTP